MIQEQTRGEPTRVLQDFAHNEKDASVRLKLSFLTLVFAILVLVLLPSVTIVIL